MYNDTDERRRQDQNNRRRRYQAPAADHEEPEEHYERGDEYDAEARYNADHARYDEHGERHDYDQPEEEAPLYDEEPARRSRLVPILMIVAAVLVVAIGVGAALYFLGVFGGSDRPVATATAPTAAGEPPPLPDAPAPPLADTAPSLGQTAEAPPATLMPDGATAENPSVPDAVVSIAPPAQGEPPVRSVHDAWQVRCDTPAGAQAEQCVLMQFVTAEDRENVGLTVIVLKTADQKARIMRILAPLGVLLPSGLGLKIDEADIGRAGFVRCLPNGCVAEVILEDQLLDQLEEGATATFIIFQTPEEGIGIPISLAGFSSGFSALP
jgi:invasion protein IalB